MAVTGPGRVVLGSLDIMPVYSEAYRPTLGHNGMHWIGAHWAWRVKDERADRTSVLQKLQKSPKTTCVMLTGNLAGIEDVPSTTQSIPGCDLEAVGHPSLKVMKDHHVLGGVMCVAGVRALSDHGQGVEDSVLHRRPGHDDGVIGWRGGVQPRGHHHYRQG